MRGMAEKRFLAVLEFFQISNGPRHWHTHLSRHSSSGHCRTMEAEFDHQRVDELLHRMQLFERGLSAVIQSLDAPPAQLAAAHAHNEQVLAERAAQERARSAHHTRVLQRQLRARARLVVELLRVRRAQVQARIAHRQQVLQVRTLGDQWRSGTRTSFDRGTATLCVCSAPTCFG
jgi:hypothetical protein